MSDNNNLQELNNILFDTLRGIKDDKVDVSKAKAVQNISSSIISNAKVQLEAFKMTGGRIDAPKVFGRNIESRLVITEGDTYSLMESFARHKGYRNVTEAISKMGKSGFNAAFELFKKENS